MAEGVEATPISSVTSKDNKPIDARGKSSKKRNKNRRTKGHRVSAPQRPYPRVPLEKAIAVARAIKEKNGGNPWQADQIATVLGVSAKGVGFTYTLLASKRFGLTEGTNAKGLVSLTNLGRELVYSGSADEELAAKRKAFLSIDVFKQVLEHYKGGTLPEMQYLGNTLQSKFNLPPEFHEEFSALFKQNAEYVGFSSGIGAESLPEKNGASATQPGGSEVIVLGEPKQKTGLVCFVIMPFVEKTTAFSKGFFDEVLNSLIIPGARDAGFEVKTANRQGTEMIHSTIVNEILDADMCVCDLTEHNPNVLFELGMRLANDKPVALIQAEGTARVFDVDNVLRVLPYKKELWRSTLQKDLPDLTAHIRATWDNREVNESYYRILRARKPNPKGAAA
jgi:hypothetical protein